MRSRSGTPTSPTTKESVVEKGGLEGEKGAGKESISIVG